MEITNNRLPRFLTTKEFQAHIVNWSIDTIKRRVKNDGLPAIYDHNSYLFPRDEVIEWFKRRQVKAG